MVLTVVACRHWPGCSAAKPSGRGRRSRAGARHDARQGRRLHRAHARRRRTRAALHPRPRGRRPARASCSRWPVIAAALGIGVRRGGAVRRVLRARRLLRRHRHQRIRSQPPRRDELQPLQDVFVALFFVSVGMLFDPAILVREPLAVSPCWPSSSRANRWWRCSSSSPSAIPSATALTVAASLAQIGEFSFILAIIGVGIDVLPAEGQNYIVAGALLSITLNPLLFAALARLRPAPRAAAPAAD